MRADTTKDPLVLSQADLQNKIQLVIHKWEYLVMNARKVQPRGIYMNKY